MGARAAFCSCGRPPSSHSCERAAIGRALAQHRRVSRQQLAHQQTLSTNKKMKNAARGLGLCKTPTKTKTPLQINVIYRKTCGVVKADGARTTLCLFVVCFVVYLPNCRDFDNSFQMAARGLLTEISWPQAVWAILPASLRLHESCHHMFNGL